MKKNRKIRTVILTFCSGILFIIFPVNANTILENPILTEDIPPSPYTVGSGARALGMGGAFIAIADDATAASWNPAGLFRLHKSEISAVSGYVHIREDNAFEDNPESSGPQSMEDYNLNYLSVAYPLKNFNMTVSLNYQHLYDFNREWSFNINQDDKDEPLQYHCEQEGGLYALGLAGGVKITDDFWAGVTLNYWGDFLYKNKWKQKYHYKRDMDLGGIPVSAIWERKREFSFQGWNANTGFLWNISHNWRLGGVLKTPFSADIDHTVTKERWGKTPEGDSYSILTTVHKEKLHMPMSYGIGVAYCIPGKLAISGDIYRTHWEDFEMEHEDGSKTSPVSGRKIADSDIDPTIYLRLGAEYRIEREKYVLPIRAGIFYDPAPAEGAPDRYYGISLGTGFKYIGPESKYRPYVFDIAYQFRFGDNVGESMLETMNFSQDVREHIVYASLIFYIRDLF